VHDGDKVIFQPLDSSDDYPALLRRGPRRPARATIVEPYPYDIAGKSVLMTSVAYPVFSHGTSSSASAGLDMALDERLQVPGRAEAAGRWPRDAAVGRAASGSPTRQAPSA
jgi:methyl-accepting chemotaxis protein